MWCSSYLYLDTRRANVGNVRKAGLACALKQRNTKFEDILEMTVFAQIYKKEQVF